ncbi:helix-turn-helix domain-containing protein [Acetobacter sicerae]|uniref:Helix-turn-helix domain-containing protein n=1 Tax=Acetobacter sicerae TaxID=85325 RepID=A0ABS8VQC6_9PROT|nr:helix-turn-helix domain-containing protein [Acetobacter sicerae]MCE0742900.1 helix-turn-helix domain-containing protein [Acetobacter sicerae]
MLPIQFTEKEAAARLGVSPITLRRERIDGNIAYLKFRGRIRYTEAFLTDYLERHTQWPTSRSELENSSSESGQTRPCGARAGLTPAPDKQSEHRLAQAFFRKPK